MNINKYYYYYKFKYVKKQPHNNFLKSTKTHTHNTPFASSYYTKQMQVGEERLTAQREKEHKANL